jgi:hypothetical protein
MQRNGLFPLFRDILSDVLVFISKGYPHNNHQFGIGHKSPICYRGFLFKYLDDPKKALFLVLAHTFSSWPNKFIRRSTP